MSRGGARPGAGRPRKFDFGAAVTPPAPLPTLRAPPAAPFFAAGARADLRSILAAAAPAGQAGDVAPVAPTGVQIRVGDGWIRPTVGYAVEKSIAVARIHIRSVDGREPLDPDEDHVDELKRIVGDTLRQAFPDAQLPWWLAIPVAAGFVYADMRIGAARIADATATPAAAPAPDLKLVPAAAPAQTPAPAPAPAPVDPSRSPFQRIAV